MGANREGNHPAEGVRVLLALASKDLEHAVYSAHVYTPTDRFDYMVTVRADGTATCESERPADAEAEERLLKVAKQVARSSARRRRDGITPWPPRITRWRGPGRG